MKILKSALVTTLWIALLIFLYACKKDQVKQDVIATSVSSTSEAQLAPSGTWSAIVPFGGGQRAFAASFSIGNKAFIVSGSDRSAGTGALYEYSPQSNCWTLKAGFKDIQRLRPIGFSIGNKGYIGLGSGKKDFWEYDPSKNLWTKKADFPGGNRYLAVGFSIGNKGYAGTGSTDAMPFHQDFWEYAPATNQWTKKADFPGSPRFAALGISINNKGYIGFGIDENTEGLRDFYEYNPGTDSWIKKKDIPGLGRTFSAGYSIDNKGFICGGYSPLEFEFRGYLKDFWQYDQDTDSWIQLPNLPGVGRQAPVGFSIGNDGYIGTGYNDLEGYEQSDIYVFKLDN
jgi:N-acetylneuraminic acid mutarotase